MNLKKDYLLSIRSKKSSAHSIEPFFRYGLIKNPLIEMVIFRAFRKILLENRGCNVFKTVRVKIHKTLLCTTSNDHDWTGFSC